MLDRLPLFVWPFLFGVVFAVWAGAIALGYLPSPLELFGDVRAECSKSAVEQKENAKADHPPSKDDSVAINAGQAAETQKRSSGNKEVYDCLLAAYTGQLAVFTKWMAGATIILAFLSVYQIRSGIKRDKIVERAYLVGGGGVTQEKPPQFRLNLGNYGKSPASMKAFSLEICDLRNLPKKPKYLNSDYNWETFIDEIAPMQQKVICVRTVSAAFEKPVVYGRFRYEDIWRRKCHFSFILRVGNAPERGRYDIDTHPDLEGVDPEYSEWK
jgi:hypothetical protein